MEVIILNNKNKGLYIDKSGNISDSTDFLSINSKTKTITLGGSKKESNKVFSQKEIEELKDAIRSTIKSMGGNEDEPEPKILRLIGKEADVYWGAIGKFLTEESYTTNIATKISEAFSSVNVIEGVTAEKLTDEVMLSKKIMDKNINAMTVSWWYPQMSHVSIYKDSIKHFNKTISDFHVEYWKKFEEVNGDELMLLDFRDDLENSDSIRELFDYKIIDSDNEEKKGRVEIYHQILPTYMQRLAPDKFREKNLLIGAYYIVFNWDEFILLQKLEQEPIENKIFKYEPRFNSLVTR